jgi:hypothetical protein
MRENYGEVLNDVKEAGIRASSDAKDTMRNLCIASGGLATGALVILSTHIPVDAPLIIFGVIVLIIEVVLGFGWLLHRHNKDAESMIEVIEKSVVPIGELLNLYGDLRDGTIQETDFDTKMVEAAKAQRQRTRDSNKNLISNIPKTDNWDIVFMGLLALGTFWVVLGLLAPYLCPVWVSMCS